MVEELLGLNYNVILVVIMVEEKPMKQCLLCDVFVLSTRSQAIVLAEVSQAAEKKSVFGTKDRRTMDGRTECQTNIT